MKIGSKHILAAGLILISLISQGQEGLKERMQKRLPDVQALLADGKVGEGNAGFLVVRNKLSPQEKSVLEAENNDRKTVYTMIAAKFDSDIEKVGKRRAGRIAERVHSGTWIQDKDGKWQKKP